MSRPVRCPSAGNEDKSPSIDKSSRRRLRGPRCRTGCATCRFGPFHFVRVEEQRLRTKFSTYCRLELEESNVMKANLGATDVLQRAANVKDSYLCQVCRITQNLVFLLALQPGSSNKLRLLSGPPRYHRILLPLELHLSEEQLATSVIERHRLCLGTLTVAPGTLKSSV